MKRLLLTGARGFIGRHCLPLLLAKGYEVHAVTSQHVEQMPGDVQWQCADLLDASQLRTLLATTKPTHLLHLAWYVEHGTFWSSVENLRWLQASVELLRLFALQGGQRIVVAGTCAEYDWRYGYCSESCTPLAPHSLYGTCKYSLQRTLSALATQTGLSEAWARIFFLYGPYEDPRRFVPSVTLSLLRGESLCCPGEGRVRDLLFVEDVAGALTAILEADVRGPVNIGSGRPIFLEDVVREIAQNVGRRDLVLPGSGKPREANDDPPLLVADVTRLRGELGWQPSHTLQSGIARTVQWWEAKIACERRGG